MDTETLPQLAPAAGEGAGAEFAAEIMRRPDWVKRVVDGIWAGLNAECRMWDKGANCLVAWPDGRVRSQTALQLWNHLSGEPVKRIIHEVRRGLNSTTPAQIGESPALIERLEQTLREAKAAAAARQPGSEVPAEVIDLPAEPPSDGGPAGGF